MESMPDCHVLCYSWLHEAVVLSIRLGATSHARSFCAALLIHTSCDEGDRLRAILDGPIKACDTVNMAASSRTPDPSEQESSYTKMEVGDVDAIGANCQMVRALGR